MQEETDLRLEADKILMAAVDEAIDNAVRNAGPELQRVGSRVSPRDYFADGVLRHLFFRLCGADPTTNTGGSRNGMEDFVWGRSVARHWERDDAVRRRCG